MTGFSYGQQFARVGAALPPRPSAPPPPPPPPSGRRPAPSWLTQEVGQLVDDLRAGLAGYRAAKRLFAQRTAHFEDRHGGATTEAEFAARDDYLRRKAIADCEWFRGEILAASAALQALRATYGRPSS